MSDKNGHNGKNGHAVVPTNGTIRHAAADPTAPFEPMARQEAFRAHCTRRAAGGHLLLQDWVRSTEDQAVWEGPPVALAEYRRWVADPRFPAWLREAFPEVEHPALEHELMYARFMHSLGEGLVRGDHNWGRIYAGLAQGEQDARRAQDQLRKEVETVAGTGRLAARQAQRPAEG